jgi:hypothetical protein
MLGNTIYEPKIYGNANKDYIIVLGKWEPYNKLMF